jgi:hypothetical protein
VYSVKVMLPIAANGRRSGAATLVSRSIAPSTTHDVPIVCSRSNGEPECGAATASHHQVEVGVVP